MKFLFYFCVAIVATLPVAAQPMFEKGFITDNDGNKQAALINIGELLSFPITIEYKVDSRASIISANPTELQSVEVSGFKIVSFNGNVDFEDSINVSSKPNFKPTSLLLKQMVEGSVNLFTYKSGAHTYFFIQTSKFEIQQLLAFSFKRPDGVISIKNDFKPQLLTALSNTNCYSENEIEQLKYDANSLKDFIKSYNNCDASTFREFNGPGYFNLKYLNISLFAGNTFYSVLSKAQLNNYKQSVFEGSKIPVFGAEFEYLLPHLKNKFSFWGSVNYKQFTDTDFAAFSGTTPDTAKLNYQALETTIGVRWYINSSNIAKFYSDIGFSQTHEVGDGIRIDYNRKSDFEDVSLPPHFVFGAGVIIKNRYALDLKFEYLDRTISDLDSAEDVTLDSITLNLKVFFKSYYK